MNDLINVVRYDKTQNTFSAYASAYFNSFYIGIILSNILLARSWQVRFERLLSAAKRFSDLRIIKHTEVCDKKDRMMFLIKSEIRRITSVA